MKKLKPKIKIKRNIAIILTYMFYDAIAIIFSYMLTVLIFYIFDINIFDKSLYIAIPIAILIELIIFSIFGIYRVMIRYMDFITLTKSVAIIMFINSTLALANIIKPLSFLPKTAFVLVGAFQILFITGIRVLIKVTYIYKETSLEKEVTGKRTIILGAGSAGELVLKEFLYNKRYNNYVVGFLDDDQDKKGRRIYNKDILGTISELDVFINRYSIEEIIVAINNISKKRETELFNIISNFPYINVRKINFLDQYNNHTFKISDVKVEDLLDREPVILDNEIISSFIKDEVVLITGGGGSIGSELSRQIFNMEPKKIIIFDIYENNAYDIQIELERIKFKNHNLKTEIVTIIGSIYNKKRVFEVFEKHRPTLVYHAAAYKHVPLMENNAREAVRTNIIGTKNLSEACIKYEVRKMVLVSSDKAVRPTNVMGATKRYAELIISYYNKIGPTKFSAVRFGNVLGSNGSVIPLFKKQIEDGGPLTVTHKDIIRYFMTIPEAVGLILQSGVFAKGGEVFVLDMGSPVKILDLAEKMIRLAGYQPYHDIKIEFTGLRPGEKLYEELLIDSKSNTLLETKHSKIFIESSFTNKLEDLDFDYVFDYFEELSNAQIKVMIQKVIKSYIITNNGHES